MFRDRLRLWHMNKNRPSAAYQRRRAVKPVDNGDETSRPGFHHTTTYHSVPRPATPDHGALINLMHTPKEMLVLQRTHKAILDWQQHLEDSLVGPNRTHDDKFFNLVTDMAGCLYVSYANPLSCGKITPHLRTMSAEFQDRVGAICTPTSILQSGWTLLSLASHRNENQWYHETSRFLINTAAEAFPDSHPSLLLLHLLFGDLTPSKLVMIYEVGSSVLQRSYGEAMAFRFRFTMCSAAFDMGHGATFKVFADVLCAATRDSDEATRLFQAAQTYLSMGSYERCSEAAQRCLAQLEAASNRHDVKVATTLWVLAQSQQRQQDFAGGESSLRRIIEIVLAKDRRVLRSSQLSVQALEAISCLDQLYEVCDMNEQRDALHLEFPSAFEL